MSIVDSFFYNGTQLTAFKILKKIIRIKTNLISFEIEDKDELVKTLGHALQRADKNHKKYQALSKERKKHIETAIAKKLSEKCECELQIRTVTIDSGTHLPVEYDQDYVKFPGSFKNRELLVWWILPVIQEQKRSIRTHNNMQVFTSILNNPESPFSENIVKNHIIPFVMGYSLKYPELADEQTKLFIDNAKNRNKRVYQKIYKSLMDYSQAQVGSETGAMFCRFFKGRWGNHHGDQVARYLLRNNIKKIEDQETLDTILNDLNKQISFEKINKQGTLAEIVRDAKMTKMSSIRHQIV